MAGNDNEIESISRGPRYPLATPGEEDVEGHRGGGETEPDSISRGPRYPLATPGEDVPGPDGLK